METIKTAENTDIATAAAWDYADPGRQLDRTLPENIGATAAMRAHYRNGFNDGAELLEEIMAQRDAARTALVKAQAAPVGGENPVILRNLLDGALVQLKKETELRSQRELELEALAQRAGSGKPFAYFRRYQIAPEVWSDWSQLSESDYKYRAEHPMKDIEIVRAFTTPPSPVQELTDEQIGEAVQRGYSKADGIRMDFADLQYVVAELRAILAATQNTNNGGGK